MQKSLLIGTSLVATLAMAAAWAADTKDTPAPPANTTATKAPIDGPAIPVPMEGVHNTFALGHKIISGSCPDGDAGYRALAQKGVKTIISVDGATPDIELAHKYGMRYVHIPVPYSGINRDQALAIARAVRDLPGPVFIHCHHGKHRGPTAAVLAAMIDEGWTTEQAQAAMKQAGTGVNYTGLWAGVRDFKKPTEDELQKADATFPETSPAKGFIATMIGIDGKWTNLGIMKEANWKAPAAHPDLDAAHEALMLDEDFQELVRSTQKEQHSPDYQNKMSAAEAACAALEAALRVGDKDKIEVAYKGVDGACKSCHAVYRDPNSLNAPPAR